MKWLARAVWGVLVLGVLGLVGSPMTMLLSPSGAAVSQSGALRSSALERASRVTRDPFGVPHIEAASERDAFFALGLVHAQDRLWQMDVLRRSAHGRLSELFGRGTLEVDRLARTLGLGRAAREEVESLPRSTRRLLVAYAAGVNRWLDEIRAEQVVAPFELRWLEAEPERWSPADTLAIVRLRAWQLDRSLGATLLLDRLIRERGGVSSQDFFPESPLREGGLAGLEHRRPELLGLLRVGAVADRHARSVGLAGPVGSLGFVVGSARTRRGRPLLVNDPHVEFELPSLFYLAHLRTPELEISGGTWPGVPVFWTGTNRAIAWGQVALHASVSTVFHETLHPSDPNRYDLNGRWLDVERREEVIEVRGEEPVGLSVGQTRHGPMLGAVFPDDPVIASYSLGWAGHGSRSGIRAHLGVQRARSWKAFRSALEGLPAPFTSYLFASADGEIGRQTAGRVPVRAIETSLLPVPGRSRYYDWRGFVAFDELPSAHGDDLPYLVAGPRLPRGAFETPVVWLWEEGGAAERVAERLARPGALELDDAIALQHERVSVRGRRFVQRLLQGVEPRSAPARKLRDQLLAWDGSTAVDSLGASLYHALRQRMAARLLEEQFPDVAELETWITSAERVPGAAVARFVERARTRESEAFVAEVLEETASWLRVHVSSNPRKRSWGQVHRLELAHAFDRLGHGSLPWVARRLNRGPFPAPGDADSVWTMHHAELPTRRVLVGPALRYAIDLADPDHAQVSLAGGQSGHADAPHYDDALYDWLRARPRPLWMHAQNIRYHATGIWQLEPAPRDD